jgi:hypothetical protein
MHDVLRQRLLRRIESLPESQVYQVLDFVEFLESKYARDARVEPTVLQKFAEGVEDKLRKQAMNPATLREAFQLIAAADRVLADVSSAGKQILGELSGDTPPRKELPGSADSKTGPPKSRGGARSGGERGTGSRSREQGREGGRTTPPRDPDTGGGGEPGS